MASKKTASAPSCYPNRPSTVIKLSYEFSVPSDSFDGVNCLTQEKLEQLDPGCIYTAEELFEVGHLTLGAPVLEEMLLEHFAQLGNIPLVFVGTNCNHAKLYKLK